MTTRPCPSRAIVIVVAVVIAGITARAHAGGWGAIYPGESTKKSVTAAWGEPTRASNKTVDGYPVTEWTYEGARAPKGIRVATVEFGLLRPSGFQPDVVRVLMVDPVPGVFTRRTIISGWGMPYAAGHEQKTPEFYYPADGLLVYFDKDGWNVERLVFTLPQAPPSP